MKNGEKGHALQIAVQSGHSLARMPTAPWPCPATGVSSDCQSCCFSQSSPPSGLAPGQHCCPVFGTPLLPYLLLSNWESLRDEISNGLQEQKLTKNNSPFSREEMHLEPSFKAGAMGFFCNALERKSSGIMGSTVSVTWSHSALAAATCHM